MDRRRRCPLASSPETRGAITGLGTGTPITMNEDGHRECVSGTYHRWQQGTSSATANTVLPAAGTNWWEKMIEEIIRRKNEHITYVVFLRMRATRRRYGARRGPPLLTCPSLLSAPLSQRHSSVLGATHELEMHLEAHCYPAATGQLRRASGCGYRAGQDGSR
jgi:hypothetical protein